MDQIAAIVPILPAAGTGVAAGTAGGVNGPAVPTLGMTFEQLLGMRLGDLAGAPGTQTLDAVQAMLGRAGVSGQDGLMGEDGLLADPDALMAILQQLAQGETVAATADGDGLQVAADPAMPDIDIDPDAAGDEVLDSDAAAAVDPAIVAAVAASPQGTAASAALDDAALGPDAETAARLVVALAGEGKRGKQGDASTAGQAALRPTADAPAPGQAVSDAAHAMAKGTSGDAKNGQIPADALPSKAPAPADASSGEAARPQLATDDRGQPLPTANAGTGIDKPSASFQATLASTRPAEPMVPLSDQIAVQMRKAAADGVDRFTIRLQPASLGTVEVRLEIGDDQRVHARIMVDRSETLDLLRRDAGALERALGNSGLQTDSNSLNFSLKGQNPGAGQNFAGQGNGQGGSGEGNDADGEQGTAGQAADQQRIAVRADGWTASGRLDLRI